MPRSKQVKLSVSTNRSSELVDITALVADQIRESGISSGVCHLFVPHTTAAVTINENADPDVAHDILGGLSSIVDEERPYRHAEGNSPAHIKSSLIGASETVFIDGGRMLLGTWQGIYFCEFDGPRSRKLYVRILES